MDKLVTALRQYMYVTLIESHPKYAPAVPRLTSQL